jgi:hypothetical protein
MDKMLLNSIKLCLDETEVNMTKISQYMDLFQYAQSMRLVVKLCEAERKTLLAN